MADVSAAVPSTSKRRIKQSLMLAQKLLQKQRELDTLKGELVAQSERLHAVSNELHECRSAGVAARTRPRHVVTGRSQVAAAEGRAAV